MNKRTYARLAVTLTVALAGLVWLWPSSAATVAVALEAESGTVARESVVTASGASGGAAVRFQPNGGGAVVANTDILAGSFVQPWLVTDWDSARFASELQYMKDVKMDHLIWQWTVNSTAGMNTAYYPTQMNGFRQHGSADLVGMSLAAAQAKGMKIWLGLNWTDNWWDKYANDDAWLNNEFAIGRSTANELWGLYKAQYADTIAGFYITMEADNFNFSSTTLQDRMANVYKSTADSIHTNTGKPVMIAPFFNKNGGQTPAQYAAMWGRIMAAAPLDVVAVQDGIGVNHAAVDDMGTWLAPLRQAIKGSRPSAEFWSDLETFTETSPGNFSPAPFSRVLSQLQAEKPYVDKFTTYSFTHYQSPHQAGTANYNLWKAYTDSK